MVTLRDPLAELRKYAQPHAYTHGYIAGLRNDEAGLEEGVVFTVTEGETFLIKVKEGNNGNLEAIAKALIAASKRRINVEILAAQETAEKIYFTIAGLAGNVGYNGDVKETDARFSELVLKQT